MGFDYEKVEKAWFKPKKTVLEMTENRKLLFSGRSVIIDEFWSWCTEHKVDFSPNNLLVFLQLNELLDIDRIFDKIQEIKKELV